MDNPAFIFLAAVCNRITEVIKRALAVQFPDLKDESVSLIVLVISFIVGALGVILFFPSANIFAGQGSSVLAELIATGIVIGGIANGFDFLGGALSNLIQKVSGKQTVKNTLTVETTEETNALKPAA